MLKLLTFACCLLSSVAHAALISLEDGSQISGEISRLNNGVYTVNTPNLGTLQIPQAKITHIQYNNSQAQPNPDISNKVESTIGNIQQQINDNPALLNDVNALKQEGDVQAVLNDEQLIDSVKNGDINALLTDPKIHNLINNPKIKAISEQLQQIK